MKKTYMAILIGTLVVYAVTLVGFFIIHAIKKHGCAQFGRTSAIVKKQVSSQIAPAPFYRKQQVFRLSYGLLHTLDKLLLITSVIYSALTAYLILDTSAQTSITITFLVISTSSSILKSSLGLDKIARPYIEAVRIMESAILRYEYKTTPVNSDIAQSVDAGLCNPDYAILLDASEKAEKTIQSKFE